MTKPVFANCQLDIAGIDDQDLLEIRNQNSLPAGIPWA